VGLKVKRSPLNQPNSQPNSPLLILTLTYRFPSPPLPPPTPPAALPPPASLCLLLTRRRRYPPLPPRPLPPPPIPTSSVDAQPCLLLRPASSSHDSLCPVEVCARTMQDWRRKDWRRRARLRPSTAQLWNGGKARNGKATRTPRVFFRLDA